jgi:orotidine-5'-phosphate decarboxylase
MTINARERLMLALDIIPDDPVDLLRFVDSLDDVISIVKVGWPLIIRWDLPNAVRALRNKNKRVFLDAKFTDLGAWAMDLVRQCEDLGVEFMTVNHGWNTVEAAVKGKSSGSKLKIFTLTLLTSLDQRELREMGIMKPVEEVVLERALQAQSIGCDGVISSGKEVSAIRRKAGDNFLIVTPGIRPAGGNSDDHRRVATPSGAIQAGADYLVVGRPITASPDPRKAALEVIAEMQRAFDAK